MLKRQVFLSVVLAALLPAGLWAQGADEAAEQIDDALALVEAAGIPIELLETLQAEGLAKDVPLDRVADAMQRRANALLTAKGAMPTSDGPAVSAGADAVEAGIGTEVLAYIESTVPSERRFVATFVLSRLVALGHAPQEALDQVEEALARGPEAVAEAALEADAALARRGPPEGFGPTFIPDFAGAPAGLPGPGSIPSGSPSGIPVGGPPGGS